jgi:carbon starvation protein
MMRNLIHKLFWLLFSFFGASAFGVVALHDGELINAIWLVFTVTCT